MTKPTAQKPASRKAALQHSQPAPEKVASTSEGLPPTEKRLRTQKSLKKSTSITESPAPLVEPSTRSSRKTPAKSAQTTPDAPVLPLNLSTSSSRFTDRFAPRRPSVSPPISSSQGLPQTPQAVDSQLANAWKTKPGREMSEAEILAMPDSEYMNLQQLDFFRARLQAQKNNLLSNAGETTEHLREDTSIVPDPADRATLEEEHALELRTRDRERKLLKKISQSLLRIENGDYGFCDETGEPIGLGRLIARPTATLSFEAQQRRELQQKMFGD